MTTRTLDATVRWAIETLQAHPHHRGARAALEAVPESSPLHARALDALKHAERDRARQPPPDEPLPDDWPAGMR